jgi:uncharacterized damage-inducible protein DinB
MKRIALSLAAVLCACATAKGQAPTTTSTQVMVMKAAPVAPAGFRAEYVAEIDRVGKKLVDLAEAMPADKYSWRPGPGVRSVAEVYMHIVVSSSRIRTFLGLPPMEGVTQESEKTITDKAQIVSLLKKSIENVRAAGANLTNADLDKTIKTPGGREMTEREVLMLLITHMHEHLGQSIAYARINGVTPPWSKGD